ncbi:hypothetical protein JTE90_026816 [Oedothorax gibbosus]|uniref:Autophagy-related protein n=1 Tax=Oedothorax gibbosus TaxID=931172 RepID=A0AAV6V6B1_9ARAC|nr:hypothetical protein JTE90_026816 [Oedothorax gibbosus]
MAKRDIYFSKKEDFVIVNSVSDDEEDLPFKERLTKNQRENSFELLREKCPDCIPVVLEKSKYDKFLPKLSTSRYLFYPRSRVSEILFLVRRDLKLPRHKSIYLQARTGILLSMSKPVLEIYADYKDEDGFLYLTYMSEDVFG